MSKIVKITTSVPSMVPTAVSTALPTMSQRSEFDFRKCVGFNICYGCRNCEPEYWDTHFPVEAKKSSSL